MNHYRREVASEVTYVRNVSIAELVDAASAYLDSDENAYRIEDDAIVFERPMGEHLVGRTAQDEA